MESAVLGMLGFGAALVQSLPIIKNLGDYLRTRAERREVKERLAATVAPVVQELQASLKDLDAGGENLLQALGNAKLRLGRTESADLVQAWIRTCDALVHAVEGMCELAGQAKSIVAFESFMKRLELAAPDACEILKLLDRSYEDGVLDVKDFPTFVKLYGPRGKKARKLEKAAKQATREAAPLIKKARSIKLSGPLNRKLAIRLKRTFDGLKKTNRLLRGLSRGKAEELNEVAPEWVHPLVEFAAQSLEK